MAQIVEDPKIVRIKVSCLVKNCDGAPVILRHPSHCDTASLEHQQRREFIGDTFGSILSDLRQSGVAVSLVDESLHRFVYLPHCHYAPRLPSRSTIVAIACTTKS